MGNILIRFIVIDQLPQILFCSFNTIIEIWSSNISSDFRTIVGTVVLPLILEITSVNLLTKSFLVLRRENQAWRSVTFPSK
jgi:hypothetical protein